MGCRSKWDALVYGPRAGSRVEAIGFGLGDSSFFLWNVVGGLPFCFSTEAGEYQAVDPSRPASIRSRAVVPSRRQLIRVSRSFYWASPSIPSIGEELLERGYLRGPSLLLPFELFTTYVPWHCGPPPRKVGFLEEFNQVQQGFHIIQDMRSCKETVSFRAVFTPEKTSCFQRDMRHL